MTDDVDVYRPAACCPDPRSLIEPRPFSVLRSAPPALRVPPLLCFAVVAAGVIAFLLGALTAEHGGVFVAVRAAFFGSAAAFGVVVAVDVREHFRLEKRLTGRVLSAQVVPLGETLLHGLIGLVLTSFFVFAQPLDGELEARDYYALAAPFLFVALGWADEIVYHRRRAQQREHILHTVAHLAAAAVLASFAALRFVDWSSVRP